MLASGFIEIDGEILGIEFWKDKCYYTAKPIGNNKVEIRMVWKDSMPDTIGIKDLKTLTAEEFCKKLKEYTDKYEK